MRTQTLRSCHQVSGAPGQTLHRASGSSFGPLHITPTARANGSGTG